MGSLAGVIFFIDKIKLELRTLDFVLLELRVFRCLPHAKHLTFTSLHAALLRIHRCAQVKDTRDVENFARMLRGLVRGHDNTIHMLQAGALWITVRSFETISVFVVLVCFG